jgi:predicted oxidoreductase (fatty acid repression mutant protein)
MDLESSKKIDEIMFETNDKITAIVNEIRLIRFSKMAEDKKEAKYNELREEFEKVMFMEEEKVEKVIKNSF